MTEEYEEGCGIPFAEEYAELEAKEYAEQCKQPDVDLEKLAYGSVCEIKNYVYPATPNSFGKIEKIILSALKAAAGRV